MHPSFLKKKLFFCCIIAFFMLFFSGFSVYAAEPKSFAHTPTLSDIIFVGDSTTYHAISRGVLPKSQVWCPSNRTLMLSSEITSLKILHPRLHTEMTIAEACAADRPRYMLFTIGINGAHTFTEGYYKGAYRKLLNAVRAASPDTLLLIESVFPVAKTETAWTSLSPAELNQRIDRINRWAEELSREFEGCRYLDTASVLRDENGFLKPEFDVGDGIHLTEAGYQAIISYISSVLF